MDFNYLMRACLIVVAMALAPLPAHAHRPHFEEDWSVRTADGRTVTIQLLYGDGIVANDPVQSVVVDDAGQIVAATPKADRLYLNCWGDTLPSCTVFDPFGELIFTPDETQLRPLAPAVDEHGTPSLYPTDRIASGFQSSTPGFITKVGLELLEIGKAPMSFGVLLVLVGFVVAVLMSIIQLPRSRSDVVPWLVLTIGRVVLAASLVLLLLYYQLVAPVSAIWLALAICAAGIPLFIRRAKRSRPSISEQRSQS